MTAPFGWTISHGFGAICLLFKIEGWHFVLPGTEFQNTPGPCTPRRSLWYQWKLFIVACRHANMIVFGWEVDMARNSGQCNGARAGLLGNWPPNTQRKCMAEIKQNKIEQVLAYREQVPRCDRVLKSFLRYSDKLIFIKKCYWPCFSSMFIFEAWLVQSSILQRLQTQNLHPKQILIRHSRQHNRDISSTAIAWRKAPYDVLFDQLSRAMLISSPC